MAIVHVMMKSSSQAPPAAAHARYIAREGEYQGRGGLELAESGNMPKFAREDPHRFWEAADAHERKNGRAYTELQIALPRELVPGERNELVREATRELMGERFAYTLAVHTPLAKDNLDQPHLHLMFSERAIDERTRELSEDQFFKRNGAKKDPEWNARDKPMEVRERWVEMMNAAMERHGHEQRLDARSWAAQGREDLAALVEPKLLAGSETEARALHTQVDGLREQRAELPAPHLGREAAAEKLEQEAERQVAEVEARAAAELSRLDRLIARARELAGEVRDRAVAFGREVRERAGSLFGREPREEQAKAAEQQGKQRAGPEPAAAPSPEMQARLDELVAGFDRRMEARLSVEAKVADYDRRMDARATAKAEQEQKQAREQAQALARRAQEQARARQQEQEKGKQREERGHSHGFGIGR